MKASKYTVKNTLNRITTDYIPWKEKLLCLKTQQQKLFTLKKRERKKGLRKFNRPWVALGKKIEHPNKYPTGVLKGGEGMINNIKRNHS